MKFTKQNDRYSHDRYWVKKYGNEWAAFREAVELGRCKLLKNAKAICQEHRDDAADAAKANADANNMWTQMEKLVGCTAADVQEFQAIPKDIVGTVEGVDHQQTLAKIAEAAYDNMEQTTYTKFIKDRVDHVVLSTETLGEQIVEHTRGDDDLAYLIDTCLTEMGSIAREELLKKLVAEWS